MNKNNKLKVVLVSHSNIEIGRGAERVFYEYIKQAPRDVSITLVQIKYALEKRLSDNTIDTIETDPFYRLLKTLSRKDFYLNHYIT